MTTFRNPQGQGQPIAPAQYGDYEGAPRAPGETSMHPAEAIARKGEEHELKKEARVEVEGTGTRTPSGTSGAA